MCASALKGLWRQHGPKSIILTPVRLILLWLQTKIVFKKWAVQHKTHTLSQCFSVEANQLYPHFFGGAGGWEGGVAGPVLVKSLTWQGKAPSGISLFLGSALVTAFTSCLLPSKIGAISLFMSLCGKRGSQVEFQIIWNQSEMNLPSLSPDELLILMLFKYSNSKPSLSLVTYSSSQRNNQ